MERVIRWPWLARSVRNKLLAMALLPLLVVLPLLVGALALWGDQAYDRLLITKVRSDLAVAHGYFDQVVAEVGGGTESVAASHALRRALDAREPARLAALLDQQRQRLGLDFLVIAPPDEPPLVGHGAGGSRSARLVVLEGARFAQLAPHLAGRVAVPLIATRNAAPSERRVEDRAMVVLASAEVLDDAGRATALLRGGVLLNQNLPFIDHINRIVYPEGSLPFGSQGTATLFLGDVRITTNVRLFRDERAIGTRVSRAVSDAVLGRGGTWLDRAFVVNDWYVSAYEPLLDGQGRHVGMLYVGYTERPFRLVKYTALAGIAVLFLAVMALAAVFSLRWARSIFRPVEQMNRAMRLVEEGDAAARVGPVDARDEIGALAQHLDHLLDVIDEKTRSLQRWADELDRKVAERTRELAASNESLRRAQQQLVKSEKLAAIGQLTASIAHEINNPIAVIQGNLDLMRDTLGVQAEPVRPELKLLDEQVERMRLIVTQLLQYARPTEYAGYVETMDVNRVLDECLVLVAHLLAQTRITVAKEHGATLRVGINRQELQQVLLNLIINAIQVMPEGGTLTLRSRDWERGVLLEVQDSGPGLSAAVRERLFRPFFTTRTDGNGLGLWISQGLVERYGGSVSAANAPGGGAVFSVRLLAEPEAPAESSAPTNNGRPLLET
ncbi:cache domain-containing protein [Ramlibacter tataouinensis]|uniref:histidine kinase n=1 Tax=Ramlibacter tataouinensis (strain ATCC BAA-407 / DSM 14655 / LMG 21543 / TTB310) TaxID=365046 RepID=F5XWM0_RAMTT|nr:cache domain-containing protein [Ramlibacter tataouinensis]AEG94164.1 candidate histidine kinase, classic [Ramlibacter tataouinensis TTB310]